MLFKRYVREHVEAYNALHVLLITKLLKVCQFAGELGEESGLVGVPVIGFCLAGNVDAVVHRRESGFF